MLESGTGRTCNVAADSLPDSSVPQATIRSAPTSTSATGLATFWTVTLAALLVDLAQGPRRRVAVLLGVVAALAMLTAALMAAPRLDFPFWGDERRTVRRSMDGQYLRNSEGELVWRQVRWRDRHQSGRCSIIE